MEIANVMRLLAQKDDRPLPPADAKRERESLSKSLAERQQESEVERFKRLSAYQSPPDWRRDTWHELPEAFEVRLVGEATQDGQSAFIIDAIWVGWFLVRVAAGSRVTLELARVDDGVWMPDRLQVFASAGLGLLKA